MQTQVTQQQAEAAMVAGLGVQYGMQAPAEQQIPDHQKTAFDFTEGFQSLVAAMAVRDTTFFGRVNGLIHPSQFVNAAEATLVGIASDYYAKYRQCPSPDVLVNLMRDSIARGVIRKDMVDTVKASLVAMLKTNIGDRDYVIDKVAEFARHRAVEAALIKSVELKQKGRLDDIERLMREALTIGANDGEDAIDYWASISERTAERREIAAGARPATGITSGVDAIDRELKHRGWGRQELTVFMGPAKSGKSTMLGEVARNASLAGYNALYVSLEVSGKIIAERVDASVSGTNIMEINDKCIDVEQALNTIAARKPGKFMIERRPAGSFTSKELERLLLNYRSRGIEFDIVCVDYLDIMRHNVDLRDKLENSKSVWVDVRDIAIRENIAIVTATQTNRDGAKASVARDTDVAEDFNKIRIADLVISINKTDQEAAAGEARLFWAASRNQRGHFTLKIKQDLDKMRMITQVIGKE